MFRPLQEATFNRTSVELKQWLGLGGDVGSATFNRTSVELKPWNVGHVALWILLLIEPVWN